ncbi:autotransporter domain-containing protein [Glaesserella parasuis]|uniref:Putative pertactin family virulence factor, outer membrane autotransporter/Type V secretory pathway, adhesin AidA n=2 Tax=Glaesserella parasuis TaxID=738 RepID=B8F4Z5_GLAP5|nr:autotransporter outer membrane beta-barrel domain-containing protein [Glaesserella parasuis]ACL32397.1 putative pertactin family virulence factor, outer membrane autotransporter/Type V secretory pathway, adhesin AidA [Glaesserella parasuis SH0165]MDG6279632.1 autotransporter domain-containing protein [Glaesserella parasuis]MDG6282850.1 autotransporter domain-containing protein [Glaesserella parasuis]MDG6324136.1 autotransporter domain-containing protein [Glaesserella parasuis]MDG6451894.1 a
MHFRKSPLALAILLCLSPIPEMNYANAQTYTVTGSSINDSEAQFRRALEQANDGDTIRLAGDIQLMRGSGFFSFDKKITIDGQGNRLHFEGYNLSLGKDVTFSNVNLSLKPSRDLNNIFGSGFNNLKAASTYIVTNGNKLILDNVRTNVNGEPADTRPMILLGNIDPTKNNNGHDALVVTNAHPTETILSSVVVIGNNNSNTDTPVTISLGENVSFVNQVIFEREGEEDIYSGAVYLAGMNNDQEHNRAINFSSSSNAITKIYTGEATNVSVTLNNINPETAITLQDVKDLTLNNSRITLDKNLSVSETLTLNNQSAITTVASKDAFGDIAKTSLMLNNIHTNGNNSNITIVRDNALLINGNITGELTINTEDKDNNVSLPNGSTLVGENGSYVVKLKTEVTQPVSENTTTDSSNTDVTPAKPTDSTPATTGEQTGSSDITSPTDTAATSNETTPPATTGDTATNSSNTDVPPATPTDSTPATTGEQTGSSDITSPTDTAQTDDQAEASSSDTATSTPAQPTGDVASTSEQATTSSTSTNHNKITITTAEQETQRAIAESRYATVVSNFALNSIRNRLEHSRSSNAYPYLTATVNGMIPTVSEPGRLWVNSSSDRITQDLYKFNNFGLQVGYDKSSALDNGTARFGFALDVEKGKANFAQFSETYKTQTYGMALYGAYETEDRHYLDVAVRMARASNELKSNASQAYHHNLYSASLAYSKGFELSNRWEIEPYTQLFYTHLSSTNYIRNGLNVTADEINSLVGSIGAKAQYQLNQTLNFYTKVAMHREFNATQDIHIIRSATDRVQHNINHRGTWTTLGLGMKARLGNNTHLYLDADKLFGNGYKQSYQITLGLDWKF